MNPDDFLSQQAVDSFDRSIDCIARFFHDRTKVAKAEITDLIHRQVFESRGHGDPLFRLFVTNSANRNQGAREPQGGWDRLAGFFANWDPVAFAERYPLENCARVPTVDLCRAFLDFDDEHQIIGGDRNYHRDRLRNRKRNGWVRLLKAAQAGGHLFASRHRDAGRRLDHVEMMRSLWGFDLSQVPLHRLTVDDLWRATHALVRVPEVGRQIALNFIKDAGYGHAFKPDVHTRDVAGQAFRATLDAYPASDAGERACVGAALAYAQALAAHGNWNGWTMSLAAVDRLLWLAGSGNLWIANVRLPGSRAGKVRRTEVARILRTAVNPRRLAA